MTEQDQPYFYLKAILECGTIIEFTQPSPGMNVVITLTPRPGIPISDCAQIKNDRLIIRSTVRSLVNVYQILRSMAGGNPQPPRKKFLGIF